jgi:hypothetical protein
MAAGGAFAGIVIGNNIARLTAGLVAAQVAWKSIESRGLIFGLEPVQGLAIATGKERPFLAGTIEGINCSVRVISDAVHYGYTRITARPPAGVTAIVGVHPSPGGILGRIRSWLGQDIEVGDKTFDETFLITGEPPAAARALLTEPLREKLLALAGPRLAGFVCERDEVVVLLHGVEVDTDALTTAIDLAVEAAKSHR